MRSVHKFILMVAVKALIEGPIKSVVDLSMENRLKC